MKAKLVAAVLVFFVFAAPSSHATQAVGGESLPDYIPTMRVDGVIHVWGSPQMRDLLHRYEEGFRQAQPDVVFEEELFSTITAVAGVYTGRGDRLVGP